MKDATKGYRSSQDNFEKRVSEMNKNIREAYNENLDSRNQVVRGNRNSQVSKSIRSNANWAYTKKRIVEESSETFEFNYHDNLSDVFHMLDDSQKILYLQTINADFPGVSINNVIEMLQIPENELIDLWKQAGLDLPHRGRPTNLTKESNALFKKKMISVNLKCKLSELREILEALGFSEEEEVEMTIKRI